MKRKQYDPDKQQCTGCGTTENVRFGPEALSFEIREYRHYVLSVFLERTLLKVRSWNL